MEFKDITDEKFRIYTFPGGDEVRIESPVSLSVSESGGHRVIDAAGVSHYVPPTWLHLRFEVKDGRPNFRF
jgi:hypothetical protein